MQQCDEYAICGTQSSRNSVASLPRLLGRRRIGQPCQQEQWIALEVRQPELVSVEQRMLRFEPSNSCLRARRPSHCNPDCTCGYQRKFTH